jgi:hypothetical protein
MQERSSGQERESNWFKKNILIFYVDVVNNK